MASRLVYEAVFASSAVEFFVSLSKRRQRKLLDAAQRLAADPFLVQDFSSIDTAGREISQLMAAGFILDYWVDHAVKQVVITDIDNIE